MYMIGGFVVLVLHTLRAGFIKQEVWTLEVTKSLHSIRAEHHMRMYLKNVKTVRCEIKK